MPHFGRLLSAMVTPFDAAGAVDYDVAQRLARHLVTEGHDGLVICGTTGESPTLSDDEKLGMFAAVMEAVDVPVIAGTVGYNTAHSVDLSQQAAKLGVHGILSLCPFYSRPSQAGIEAHFRAIADAAGIPLLVQDSPQVTGVPLDVPTLVAMHDAHPLIGAVKSEIPGAGAKASAIHEAGLELVAGWGGLNYLEQVERGAVGCFPGCDLGPAIKTIDTAARTGDRHGAQQLYRAILPFLSLATASLDLLLLTAKRHMRRRGLFSSEALRAPARTLDPQESRTVDALLDELTALETPGF